MKKAKLFLYLIIGALAGLTVLSLVASFGAISPADLRADEQTEIAPIAIEIPTPPKTEELPEPPPQSKPEASLLATLAPDSFAGPQDLGAGVAFGSGGSGPAVGGGGGFGTDASQLVQDRSNIHRPPRLVMKGSLEYPSDARNRSISGYVILKILVSSGGSVDSLEVEESEPKGIFEQAAIKSVRSWKFEPAMVKGQIVAAWTSQKIKFELN